MLVKSNRIKTHIKTDDRLLILGGVKLNVDRNETVAIDPDRDRCILVDLIEPQDPFAGVGGYETGQIRQVFAQDRFGRNQE